MKHMLIGAAHAALKYETFVETGTFTGETAEYASSVYAAVHTVELSPVLAGLARQYLAPRSNVAVHEGDSSSVLPQILAAVDGSCVFWLDAHYSGGRTARGAVDTPILSELAAIGAHHVRPHCILIDDCRVFGTDDAYPTLEEVVSRLRDIDQGFRIGVACDVIWAAPVPILEFAWRVTSEGVVVPPDWP